MRPGAYTLEIRGKRMDNVQELAWYDPGIDVQSLQVVGEDTKHVEARIRINAACRHGEHAFRVRAPHGYSQIYTFFVGPYPDVQEAEPNSAFDEAQAVPLNSTVVGIIQNEDTDYYRVTAAKGQRLSVEVESMRLGYGMLDTYVAILDNKRFELSVRDDGPLLGQDPYAGVVAPYDGEYTIEIRESAYRGNGNAHYRLHIGTFARPTAVYPAGGAAGQAVEMTFLGDVLGPIRNTQQIPGKLQELPVWPLGNEVPPSPLTFRVSSFPNLLETEPNNVKEEATEAPSPVPVALNGVIEEKDDEDWFLFTAKKDQVLQVEVYARRIQSPLDPVAFVAKADGSRIDSNDDSSGVDSGIRFTAPEDGKYLLQVRDHLHSGGEDYVYRVEIIPVLPQLTLKLPVFDDNNPQIRHTIAVPQGNWTAVPMIIARAEFGGPVQIAAAALPAGITLHAPPIDFGTDQVPVLFHAAEDAPIDGGYIRLTGRHEKDGRVIIGGYRQEETLVLGEPQRHPWHTMWRERLPVSVTEKVPFAVDMATPTRPIIHGGSLDLRIVAKRDEGFNGPIHVKMLYHPTGITSENEVTIPEGQSETTLSINANGNAAARTYPLSVTARADAQRGNVWIASPFTDVEVTTPYLSGSIEMVAVEQGKDVEVVCALDHAKPFAGNAQVRLHGLPPKTETVEAVITTNDTEAVFLVKAQPDSPTGKHKVLFCSVDVPYGDEIIRHSVGALGTLRIDSPRVEVPDPEPEVVAVVEPEPEPPKKDEPRLTRLEQLRKDREEKRQKQMETQG